MPGFSGLMNKIQFGLWQWRLCVIWTRGVVRRPRTFVLIRMRVCLHLCICISFWHQDEGWFSALQPQLQCIICYYNWGYMLINQIFNRIWQRALSFYLYVSKYTLYTKKIRKTKICIFNQICYALFWTSILSSLQSIVQSLG